MMRRNKDELSLEDKKKIAESMEVAENARQQEWHAPSFVAEMFMGKFDTDLIHPYPEQDPADKKIGDEYCKKMEKFLIEKVNPDKIDADKEMPADVLQGLKDMGAFGMQISKEYGGLGLSKTNYVRALQVAAGHCGNTVAWLSAHQSIGAPQPLKIAGTAEQKKKFLPRLTREVSAFALTEPGVGSDPAGMKTVATPSPDGKSWTIEGEKLWCTNGAAADIIIVMARTPDKVVNGKSRKQISAFLVEKTMPGFEMHHRCRFMGLNAIANGYLRFNKVKVPAENMVGKEGDGLKIALETLNTGRLSLPGACVGLGKKCLEIVRHWTEERFQWGTVIGNHEEIATKVTAIAANTFAMEAITHWACQIVDHGGADIRLEAAMAKLFCTERSWWITNETLQIRGGRGYENANSLKARGEIPVPLERYVRDIRINTILEGSTEVMHLFIAREALDKHMRLVKALLDPHSSIGAKLTTLLKAGVYYLIWYPRQWFYWALWPKHFTMGPKLSGHFRYIDRMNHKLARNIFHMMLIHGPKLERRQLILARLVEIGTELFAMAMTCARAHAMLKKNPVDQTPRELADLFCLDARRRIKRHFAGLLCNEDRRHYRLSKGVREGKYKWLEDGMIHGNIPYKS